jgi:hypothetical protein
MLAGEYEGVTYFQSPGDPERTKEEDRCFSDAKTMAGIDGVYGQ